MSRELLFLALLPGILIIIYIFRKDRVEHEPVSLMVKLVVLGALSCIPAVIMETALEGFAPSGSHVTSALYEAFVVAALCEELCKFALLNIGSWKNRNFDYRFDGIVYAVAVAVGFALLENVLYVMSGGIGTALVRGVLSVPIHAFCGVYMGIYYGGARKCYVMGQRSKLNSMRLKALIVPIVIHGIYDGIIFLDMAWSSVALIAFVVLMYIKAIGKINKYSKEDWSAGFYTQKLSDLPLDED